MATKRRQIFSPPTPQIPPTLIPRCAPENIANILAHRYHADLAAMNIEASLDSVRSFARALMRGEISLDKVKPAKIAVTSQLSKAYTEDAKQFAKDLAALIALHDGDTSETLPDTFVLLLNRGILPLFTLTNDPGKQQVVAAISERSGLSTGRVIEVCAVVEQHDEVVCAFALRKLYKEFLKDNDLELTPQVNRPEVEMPSLTLDMARNRKRSDQPTTAASSVQINNGRHTARSGGQSHKQKRLRTAEEGLLHAISELTELSHIALINSKIFCDDILSLPRVLPDLAALKDPDNESLVFPPPNMWLLASGSILSSPRILIVDSDLSSARQLSTSTHEHVAMLLYARTIDIFMEAILARDIALVLLTGNERNEAFIEGARNITHILNGLSELHTDMARGLKYPGTLRSHAVTTSSYWAHLSRNPLVFQSSDRPSFPLDDIQLVSVGSHLPLEMTGALLTGNVCGDVWSMGPSDVELMKAFMEGIDGSDRIIDLASDLRESYGTHGDKVSVADRTPLIIVQDVKEFTDFFRPLTSLYRYVPVQPASKRVELTLPGL